MFTDNQDDHNGNTEGPSDELPEAFTMNIGEKQTTSLDQPSVGDPHTSTGINVVTEGSEESFPASDPPSTMAQSTLPKDPVQTDE